MVKLLQTRPGLSKAKRKPETASPAMNRPGQPLRERTAGTPAALHGAVPTDTTAAANMQQTLILIKPDALERGLAGTILARFEAAGLRVENCRLVRPALALIETHYGDLRKRDLKAFERTTRSLANQPFLATLLVGHDAITKVRALCGPTDPSTAPAGTIRGDFGNDSIQQADAENRATRNLVHAADSEASVARETALWFSAAPPSALQG